MKKSEKVCLAVLFLLYAAFLIMGIVGMVDPKSGILWSGNNMSEYHVEAFNFLTGLVMIAISSTVGIMIAFKIMRKRSKKAFLTTIVITLIVMIVLDVVFFVVKSTADNGGYDAILSTTSHANGNISDGLTLVIALIISQIGILFMYISKLIHINPDALSKGILKFLVKFRLYHENVFYIIGTIMLTFGVFVSVYILIVAIAILLLMIMVILVRKYGVETTKRSYEVYEDGSTRTLTYDGYYLGRDRFVDDVGGVWYSDDGCRTFYH